MDGTQYITQYPIQPQGTIRYRFLADLPGTFFYHSHFADQRALGAFGPMIIRSIKDPAERLYDVDTNIMFLNDWVYDGDIYLVKNILIDGLGQRQNGTEQAVFKEYSVKRGHRYRFRVIYSSATNCTLDISVDNHMLKVISSDSFAIKPVTAESIGITSGERFDFILDANQNVGNYWIRIQGNYACGGMIQGAVLRYEGSKGFPNVTDLNVHKELKGVQVNPTVNDRNEKDIPLVEAKSLKPWSPSSIYPTYYLNVTMEDKGMGNFDFFINRIYYEAETRFSLLQVKDAISYSDYYCNLTNFESNGTDCSKTTCKCPHLIDVPCKRYVEFFFFNPSMTSIRCTSMVMI
uniref:Plastocyanin-like domain-containing protein n=1 Tax=Megaselia scalaris TaxID=36166 RepID=T1GC90_MEGSC